MPRTLPMLGACLLAAAALSGCRVVDGVDLGDDSSLLQAASSAPQAATLEVYWAALPAAAPAEDPFWDHVHENRLPADLRRRLAVNGLRAGVVSGVLPDDMHDLLNPTGGEGEDPASTSASLQQTGVWRRTRQLRHGDHIELKACEPRPVAPLLVNREGELVGETLTNVQAFYKLKAEDLTDGRCVLSLTPEVRHGAPKPRYTPDETGVISLATPKQDAMVFSELSVEASLAPGEVLVVTSLRDAPSLLGGFFHSPSTEDQGRRKAILIRVVQAPRANDFPPIDAI